MTLIKNIAIPNILFRLIVVVPYDRMHTRDTDGKNSALNSHSNIIFRFVCEITADAQILATF